MNKSIMQYRQLAALCVVLTVACGPAMAQVTPDTLEATLGQGQSVAETVMVL